MVWTTYSIGKNMFTRNSKHVKNSKCEMRTTTWSFRSPQGTAGIVGHGAQSANEHNRSRHSIGHRAQSVKTLYRSQGTIGQETLSVTGHNRSKNSIGHRAQSVKTLYRSQSTIGQDTLSVTGQNRTREVSMFRSAIITDFVPLLAACFFFFSTVS